MRTIRISDVTMKYSGTDGEFTLSFREKIELAKLLDRLGVSVIESAPIRSRKTDSLLIKSLASAVKDSTLAVPVELADPESVAVTWNALKEARHPRMQVAAPVSTVQMEYFYHKKPDGMLAMIRAAVSACRALCPEVEFLAEDAGRSEREFLLRAIGAAVEAGASTVTVCDTAGTLLPDEFYDSVKQIRESVPAEIRLGVRCSNELYMADSCAMAAVRAGADEVKAAACGEATASLEKIARILQQRGDVCGAVCGVHITELQRVVAQIRWMCRTNRSKNSPFDDGVREQNEDLSLTSHDDVTAVSRAVAQLGYELSEEDVLRVYEAFTHIAAKKEQVGAKELDAIVASAALQVPSTYRLESFVINSGNIITATAHVRLQKQDRMLEGICVGDGPIDAAFLAIEQIVGCHYELDDFQIQAITEGREAMGETVVRLRNQGKVYSGRGISTDIVGSSIHAYLSAVNKIVYEEAEV